MIDTSTAYKEAVVSHNQEWAVRATIDYTDYNLDNSISPSVSTPDRQSIDSQMADGIEQTTFKFFPSWDRFEWGAGYHLRSETKEDVEQGALSQQLSNVDSEFPEYSGGLAGFTCFGAPVSDFVSYPTFSISFSERTVQSLKVVFDQQLLEWAETFDVKIFVGGTLGTTENVTNNNSYRWEKTLSSPVLLATRIEIVIYDWNYPYTKAKIIESFTSIQEKYEMSDIIELSIFEESEPDDATTPIGNVTANTCNLELINEIMSNDISVFDNDNPLSILAGNITKNRRIKLYATLVDQEIPLGTFYSQSWNINEGELGAEVSGQDLITLMADQEYTDNQFISPQADVIDEVYDTTAEFNTFTRDNITVGTDQMTMAGSVLLCDGSLIDGKLSGFFPFGSIPIGSQFCGTAEKIISFTYSPGSSVTVCLSWTGTAPIGTGVRLFVSYKTIEDYVEINGDYVFVFTPENISNTSQQIKIKALLYSSSTSISPTVESIIINADEFVTLYSIAAKVIDDFNDITGLVEGNFSIDQSYGEYIIPNAYLEPQTFRSVLRLVAEAGAGRAYIGRDGGIKVEAIQEVEAIVKDYDKSSYFEKAQPVNAQSLYNRITVVTQPLMKAAATSTLATVSVDFGDNQIISVEWDDVPSEFDSFESVADLTVNSSTAYTWGIELDISNTDASEDTLDMEIYGYVYTVTGSKRISLDNSESTRKNGVIEYVIEENPLIQSEAQANLITQTLINSLSTLKNEVSADALPDPSLEVGDSVTFDSKYYIINSNEIDFSGGQLIHQIGGKS